jgi:diguanylate cyclase (GGDEF)-like protein
MAGRIQDWIVRQLAFGEFSSYKDVCRKSVWIGAKVALVAYGLNLACHFLLYALGLMPYSLASALVIATVLTPPITFVLSVAAYIAVGFAIHDLGVSRAELKRLSNTDMLSGLANRRAFQSKFDQCDRDKSLAVFDIDRFKAVNDSHGHLTGDRVIAEVARELSRVFGARCLCGRIGGEEFAVFTDEVPFAEFAALCELARMRIANLDIELDNSVLELTISAGVARGLADETFSDTFFRADKMLYSAKTSGRNRVMSCYGTDNPGEESSQAKSA